MDKFLKNIVILFALCIATSSIVCAETLSKKYASYQEAIDQMNNLGHYSQVVTAELFAVHTNNTGLLRWRFIYNENIKGGRGSKKWRAEVFPNAYRAHAFFNSIGNKNDLHYIIPFYDESNGNIGPKFLVIYLDYIDPNQK